ncbi:MAG: PfkB family carbohydrate kinase [Planctomycetota bacterium]
MSSGDPRFDVIGLGCVAVDDLLVVDRFPASDEKCQVLERHRQCGGLAATALIAASRLGARSAYMGPLAAEDEFGRFALDTLRANGVDVSHVESRGSAIRATIVVGREPPTRNVFYDLSASLPLSPEHPPRELLEDTRVLLVDHYGAEAMVRAATIAREQGVAVVGDFEREGFEGFPELLDRVDHLILSRDFALRWTGTDNPDAAVQALWHSDRDVVAVTCGADGYWFRTSEHTATEHAPSFVVRTVDTTGCGDVFHGAYAAALAAGFDARDRLRRAAAAAAVKATHPGGQAGIPDAKTLDAFLERHLSPRPPTSP